MERKKKKKAKIVLEKTKILLNFFFSNFLVLILCKYTPHIKIVAKYIKLSEM